MTSGEGRTLKIKTVEEVYDDIRAGYYELDDFKSWLALWSVKILDMADERRRETEEYDTLP